VAAATIAAEDPMKIEKLPLILLPGLTDDESIWRHQLEHLADVAACTALPITQHDRVGALAEAVLASAPARFALAGFSLGGYVSLEIMRRAPERVVRLALLATGARADTEERRSERHVHIALASDPVAFEKLLRDDLAFVIHPDRLQDETLTGQIISTALRVGPQAFVRQHLAAMHRPPSLADLRRITCPTLILCGRQDRATPVELSEELAAEIPNSRFVLIEDCGHYLSLERPQAVTALLREWLLYPPTTSSKS
jgi:pimeloyl-ACP methyl ester carboxylesterase